MAQEPFSKPVEDSVNRDGGVAIGEDLGFQRRWWMFEKALWSFFLLLLVGDVLGLFGRGWLAKAKLSDPAQGVVVDYERVERASTPSTMTMHLDPAAIHDGQVRLFVSEDVIRPLGAQRISPQPLRSTLAPGGVEYTFPAQGTPATIEFQLEPSFPGVHHFRVAINGEQPPLEGRVVVLP